MIATGHSIISIAKHLNERSIPTKGSKDGKRKFWHSLTIRRMIKNSSYIGKTYFGMTSRLSKAKTVQHPQENWTLLDNVTPAIISEELFSQANKELNKPKVRTGYPKNEYLLRNHAFCSLCGRPLVGHCLNKKYRYYQCSGARPYENTGKQCSARYIRADDLESKVWDKTQVVLANPGVILTQLADSTNSRSMTEVEIDIVAIKENLRTYERRRTNLLQAMELGEFEKDEILDRLNNLKNLRHEDETKLSDLLSTRDNIQNLAKAKIRLNHLYDHVMENLDGGTEDVKRLALDALDIRVYASPDNLEIKGVIPLQLDLPTIAQTSASRHEYNCRRLPV